MYPCRYHCHQTVSLIYCSLSLQGRRHLSVAAKSSQVNLMVHPPAKTFHKRPLPPNLIALSSAKGKQLFREALDQGGLEAYFPLAEQFITQVIYGNVEAPIPMSNFDQSFQIFPNLQLVRTVVLFALHSRYGAECFKL